MINVDVSLIFLELGCEEVLCIADRGLFRDYKKKL